MQRLAQARSATSSGATPDTRQERLVAADITRWRRHCPSASCPADARWRRGAESQKGRQRAAVCLAPEMALGAHAIGVAHASSEQVCHTVQRENGCPTRRAMVYSVMAHFQSQRCMGRHIARCASACGQVASHAGDACLLRQPSRRYSMEPLGAEPLLSHSLEPCVGAQPRRRQGRLQLPSRRPS